MAAAILDMGCSVGVSDHTPLQGPVTAAWWQKAGGLWRGLGRSSKKGDKESNFGGIRVNISLWCGGHDLLQLRPGGRE